MVVMLALILLTGVAFAVDLSDLWFHRQSAQSAADAACLAGATDLYAITAGVTPPSAGFTAGTASDCVSSPGASMCSYANFNGYNGAGLNTTAASNSVSWTFPPSVPGAIAPPASVAPNPFLQVVVRENVNTWFTGNFGSYYQQVAAACTCGLVQEKEAAPVVVLNPSLSGAFTYNGGGRLTIVGGPQRSLQVNSNSSTGILWGASGVIDTSNGGPSQTGSDVAVVGGPAQAPSSGGFNGGTTGHWNGSVLPIGDPYAGVPVPSQPALATTASQAHVVAYGYDGCPDHYPTNYVRSQIPHSGCLEFEPGYYPNTVNLNANDVAIFKPGIYYMNASLNIAGSDDVRLATPCKPQCSPYSTTAWQQTDGVMFYFLQGSLNISGGTGELSASRVDPVPSTALTCDGSAPNASLGMPSALNGNILIAQCATNATYWDTNGDTSDSRGNPGSRGLLVFQDHANTTQPQFGGSGSLSFSGALYFHSSSYSDVLSMTGASSSGTFILGQIVSDQISLTGSGAINLALNPVPSTYLVKVAMLQ